MNKNRSTLRYLIGNFQQMRGSSLTRFQRRKKVIYQKIRNWNGFGLFNSTPRKWGKRIWGNVFKILKGNALQSRVVYPAKLSNKCKDRIKSFSDLQSLKKCIFHVTISEKGKDKTKWKFQRRTQVNGIPQRIVKNPRMTLYTNHGGQQPRLVQYNSRARHETVYLFNPRTEYSDKRGLCSSLCADLYSLLAL